MRQGNIAAVDGILNHVGSPADDLAHLQDGADDDVADLAVDTVARADHAGAEVRGIIGGADETLGFGFGVAVVAEELVVRAKGGVEVGFAENLVVVLGGLERPPRRPERGRLVGDRGGRGGDENVGFADGPGGGEHVGGSGLVNAGDAVVQPKGALAVADGSGGVEDG